MVAVTEEAQRHIAALRLRNGEQVRVLNGKGLITVCEVDRSESALRLRKISEQLVDQPAARTLVLSILDNRDRFEFALEKATELGITRFVPLSADASQHHRINHGRLVAKAIAAITQCGVAWLPEICEPTTIDKMPWGTRLIIGDEKGAEPSAEDLTDDVTIVVGPEGDFSERERAALTGDPRSRFWAIGSNRLRAETAAVALMANVISR